MSRRQWIGLAAVLFGITMFVGIVISGTTPDRDVADASGAYQSFWEDGGHQDRASIGTVLLTYAVPLLLAMAAGLRWLLGRRDEGPLPGLVLAAGAAAAALLGVGAALINGAGIAGAEGGYPVDGSQALLTESLGYYTVTASMMAAAAMVVAVSLSNRTAGVLPGWTIVLTGLLVLAGLGSIFTAWIGFMLLPLWSVVVGICLLVRKDSVAARPAPAADAVSA